MTVYVVGLIINCAQTDITHQILRWLHHFLQTRNFKVFWRGLHSSTRNTHRGVPQGQFLVLFYSSFSCIISLKFWMTLGTTICFMPMIFLFIVDVSLLLWCAKLQEAVRLISQWCRYWEMSIGLRNHHGINLFRRCGDCDFDFSINGGLIERSEKIKFLGFYITRHGGVHKYIKYIRKKLLTAIKS